MFRYARILAALTSVMFAGCGGESAKTQNSNAPEKAKPQTLTVDEFYADTSKEERELRLVGQLKSWQQAPGEAQSFQATIAGEKMKTCSIFVSKPGDVEAPKVGKWIIVNVRGNNQPVSRSNGQFTKGSLHLGGYETQEEALKALGR